MKKTLQTISTASVGPPAWIVAAFVVLVIGDCCWHGFSYTLGDSASLLAGLAILVALTFVAAGKKAQEEREKPAPAMPTLFAASAVAHQAPPSVAPETPKFAGPPTDLEKTLAEIAVLAWKIDKRAQKEATPPKSIIRNATRIIEMLGEHKVAMVSYEGRRIFDGSDVDVLEAVEDVEEDQVVEQHEPEIQIRGKLVRKALLTVGKKKKPYPTSPASSMTPPTTSQPTL